jgi:site-specific DNA-methyltransferase (adenine-specific)
MIELYNQDNMTQFRTNKKFSVIYADCIYENLDLDWIYYYWNMLDENSIFMVQTDYHSVAEYKLKLDKLGIFINWCIFINDWGGTSRKGFPQKHDDILIYANGHNWKWNKLEIQIPKVTAGTKFDKKGTGLKTPCSVFYDHASFSTMSKERIKTEDNHNIKWQKPYWLMDRLLKPFTEENDYILEPFGGTFSACRWAKMNHRNAVGIELDKETFELGKAEVEKANELPVQMQLL